MDRAFHRDSELTLRRVERHQLIVEVLIGARVAKTTATLADELGVTSRTIERDLARLRDAGVPIVSQPGPGGGARWGVPRGSRTLRLDTSEIAVLIASLTALGPTGDTAGSAMAKLIAALAGDT